MEIKSDDHSPKNTCPGEGRQAWRYCKRLPGYGSNTRGGYMDMTCTCAQSSYSTRVTRTICNRALSRENRILLTAKNKCADQHVPSHNYDKLTEKLVKPSPYDANKLFTYGGNKDY